MTYSDHLEIARSLPPYERTERCENCDQILGEDEGQLVKIHYARKTVTMTVCDRCSNPILVEVVQLSGSGLYWILWVDGLGKNRKEVEAIGATIPETLDKFRERYIEVFDREVCKLIWK